jgi:hypothetical protein
MTDLPMTADSQAALFQLSETAKKFGINPDRPFFPVNSLRLLYFILLEQLTGNKEAIEIMNSLIPKIEAVISARNQDKFGIFLPALNQDLDAVKLPLQDLFATFPSENIEHFFEQLLGFTLPSQDHQLSTLSATLTRIQKPASDLLLESIELRAQDSIIFSSYVIELIRKYSSPERPKEEQLKLFSYLHWQIHMAYQVNDLVDSVVFAKEDMDAQAFSPIQIVQQITQDPQEAKNVIQEAASTLLKHSQSVSFSPDLDGTIASYNGVLLSVIGL